MPATSSSLHAALAQFLHQEQLPLSYLDTVEQSFLPLAEELQRRLATRKDALLVGVSGCQGSGKSTLAALLVLLLKEMAGLRCINLSLDDFYLTRAERMQLAETVHPLLATRGVPGTHDVPLALATIAALRQPGSVAIPRFDKASDDRCPREQWPLIQAPVDVIVLEGWCLAVPEQSEAALAAALNALEATEDTQGHWRTYVNRQIADTYAPLYAMIDFLIMLKAPDFASVYRWRQQQENKLAARQQSGQGSRVMNGAQLQRFIQHYERLTRHGLDCLPAKADVVFQLTAQQSIAGKLKG